MVNLNYLFNKKYYDKINDDHFEKCNKELVNACFNGGSFYENDLMTEYFDLKTLYPGLLVGIGNVHESGEGDNEIRLGFSFDFVTGMPYIPGSTVKGVLRSVFKRYPVLIEEILKIKDDLEHKRVREIEKEIFDNGDVFFDAVIIKGDKDGKIIALDNITPHLDELKDPKPLTMLKVRSNVTFRFRFKFTNNKLLEICKKNLFEELIKIVGMGAKTNTGYGYLV